MRMLGFTKTLTDIMYLYMLFPIILYVNKDQRARSIYYFAVWSAVQFTSDYAKLSFWQARPYWVNPEVLAPYCSTQFGNPSGHAMGITCFGLTMWLDFNASVDVKSQFSSYFMRGSLLVIALMLAGIVCYMRAYCGVHDPSQVMQGIVWGLWLTFTLHYLIRKRYTASV